METEAELCLGSNADSECELMLDTLQRELDIISGKLEGVTRRVAGEDQSFQHHDQDQERTTLLAESRSKVKHSMRPLARRKKATMSWEAQMRYVQLVEEKEAEMQTLRVQCLQLMERHISQQMKQLDEISVKLNHSMEQRLQKEKTAKQKLKHAMVRSQLSTIPPPAANLFKGTYYRLASIEHLTRQQRRISAADRKRKEVFIVEKEEEEEEEDEGVSNSWAITASIPVNETDDRGWQACDKWSHRSSPQLQPPTLKPLEEILGCNDSSEKLQQQRHNSELNRLAGKQRRLKHMFDCARANQAAASAFSLSPSLGTSSSFTPLPPLPALDEECSSLAVSLPSNTPPTLPPHTPPPHTLPPHTPPSHTPPPHTLPHTPSPHTTSHTPSPGHELQLKVPPLTLPSPPTILPPVPLTADGLMASGAEVKESRHCSSLWSNYLVIRQEPSPVISSLGTS